MTPRIYCERACRIFDRALERESDGRHMMSVGSIIFKHWTLVKKGNVEGVSQVERAPSQISRG